VLVYIEGLFSLVPDEVAPLSVHEMIAGFPFNINTSSHTFIRILNMALIGYEKRVLVDMGYFFF
jgi:hypothetical protein